MKNFEYAAPRTEAEVLELLSDEPGKTELLAGGTDLVGLMKKMIVTPDRVVNIMEIPSLKEIEPLADGGLRIGAAVTLDELLDHPYLDDYPAIKQAIRGINSMQLQCQGTIGGDICQRPRCWFYRNGYGLLTNDARHVGRVDVDVGRIESSRSGSATNGDADYRFHAILGNSGPAKFVSSSRIGPALIALGAEVRVFGPTDEDEALLPASEFFRTPRHESQRETVLQPNQLLTHFVLPPANGRTNATYEVRHGEGPDMPLAAAAASLKLDSFGTVRDATVVLGQVAPTPWVSQDAARQIIGLSISDAVAEAAGQAAVAQATPLPGNEYKVHLSKVAVKRAILLAAGLETGGF
jgi:xanthine dehydrogenase YagS FAD-binding subunit